MGIPQTGSALAPRGIVLLHFVSEAPGMRSHDGIDVLRDLVIRMN
jgi:hypothetical protein